ncbi:MAG: GNAT family N-acetyltransferase [Candidimonas sp.]
MNKTKNINIDFITTEDIYGDKNRGWIVHKIQAIVDGKEIGYLKISYIPKERFDNHYKSIPDYLDKIEGRPIYPINGKIEIIDNKIILNNATFDEMKKIANNIYYHANEKWPLKIPTSRVRLLDFIEENLEKLSKRWKNKFIDFKNFHVDRPIIDYISVSKEYRRMGIGTSLYKKGAELMNSKGLKLYASGLQTDSAKATWEFMRKNNLTRTDKKGEYMYVD